MKLRDDPRMVGRTGLKNWPPRWTTTRLEQIIPEGEVGTFQYSSMHESINDKIFLTMIYKERHYMGLLQFADIDFCAELYRLLQQYTYRPMAAIGDIELNEISPPPGR